MKPVRLILALAAIGCGRAPLDAPADAAPAPSPDAVGADLAAPPPPDLRSAADLDCWATCTGECVGMGSCLPCLRVSPTLCAEPYGADGCPKDECRGYPPPDMWSAGCAEWPDGC